MKKKMKLAAIFVVTVQAFAVEKNAKDSFVECFRAFEKDLKKSEFNFRECNNKLD